MGLGPPPSPFEPLSFECAAGTVLFRVHDPVFGDGTPNDGTVFNPGFGGTMRWSFFDDETGETVPVLYAAETGESAVYETILHDAVPGSFIPRTNWAGKVATVMTLRRNLTLARFDSEGLRRFGLHARDLTDTDADVYPQSVVWAQAAHNSGFDGVTWMSRQRNSDRAYCFFGDRVQPEDLAIDRDHIGARVFGTPADGEWLADLALQMRAMLRPG